MARSESSKGSVNGSTSASTDYTVPTTVGVVNHDPTKCRAPSYSFGVRYQEKIRPSPGPQYKVESNLTSRGQGHAPSYSLTGRPRPIFDFMSINSSPGPSAYNTNASSLQRRGPGYSFGLSYNTTRNRNGPGPDSYFLPTTLGARVPHLRGAPAATLLGKGSTNKGFSYDQAKTPGPARYAAVDPSYTTQRAPAVTLKSRPKLPPIKFVTPGPGAYDQSKGDSVAKSSPRFSMGIRHGEKVRPMFTLADVSE
ncbi:hypothetical protein ACOMHN_067079 [Nucella lapillus]